MKHVILFCYIFAILIAVSVLTIQLLANKKQKTEKNQSNMHFIGALLLMNLYDLLIYYNDNILEQINQIALVRLGDCFIAVIIYLWIATQSDMLKTNPYPKIIDWVKIYTKIYLCIWMICTFAVNDNNIVKWIYACTDVTLLVFLIVGSIIYAKQALDEGQPKYIFWYMITVAIMMSLNYISYFISEVGARWGDNEYISGPMNLTIFYWFVINIANLLIAYRSNFSDAYKASAELNPFNLETALDELKEKYDLTAREKDLVREIYEGKSNNQIASDLFISESTVKTHIYNIFRKIDVKNRVEVVCALRGDEKIAPAKAE